MEIKKCGLGSIAWRITEPDAPEQFALVYHARSMTIADDPETEPPTFVLFNGSVNDACRHYRNQWPGWIEFLVPDACWQ